MRWEEYTRYKSPVKGTRFISFKVPLEQGICQRLEKELWFTPSDLIDSLESDSYKLGLVIDLTNTKRYYKPTEIEGRGVGYIKINTEGRVVPSKIVQNKFAEIVNDFLERNTDNDLLVGVHCTHGLNRTGYMVCRYMIDHLNFQPKDAIDAFNEARGYSIERENYIADLLNTNRDPDDLLPVDKVSDGEIVEDEDSESGITSFPSKPVNNSSGSPPPGEPISPERFPDAGRGGYVPRGNYRGRYQNDFRGRGFQRRPWVNRGYQNNYNRGGYNQNFDNRGGFNNQGFGNRGNMRGGYNRGGFQQPYDMEDDLDDDTEVIITETERGTIIREERSISEHRRKMAEEGGRGGAASIGRGDSRGWGRGEGRGRGNYDREDYQKRSFDGEDRYRSGRPSRGPGNDWEDERPPPKKKYFGTDREEERREGSWRGRGGFDDRGRGRGRGGFEEESWGRGKFSFEDENRGKGRPGFDEEPRGRKMYEEEAKGRDRAPYNEEPRIRKRESFDEEPWGRGRGMYEGEGRGRGRYESEGRGRGAYESEGRGRGAYESEGRGRGRMFDSGRTSFEGRGGEQKDDWPRQDKAYPDEAPSRKTRYREDPVEEEMPKRYRRSYSPQGPSRRSWSPEVTKSYRAKDPSDRGEYEGSFRGRGDVYNRGRGESYSRGRGEGHSSGRGAYAGRGRGRDMSPVFRDREESPPEYRPKPRVPSHGGESPASAFRVREEPPQRYKERESERSFRSRDGSPPAAAAFRKKPFQDEVDPASFRKKLAPAKYRRPSSDFDDVEDDENIYKKRLTHYDEAFRGRDATRGRDIAPRGRGGRDTFKARDSFHDDDSDNSPPPVPRRRVTPPAQYRDPEPGFKGREESPPFREDSPPFRGSDDGFRVHEGGYRGRGREESFRGRGRGDSFQGHGSFQRGRGGY